MLCCILHYFAMYWIAHVKVRMESCSVTLLTNTVFLVRQLVFYIPVCCLTGKLKNYPPLLCQSLACMATEWAAANFEVPATEKSDIDFLAYVAHLRCGYNLSACRGQDYASN